MATLTINHYINQSNSFITDIRNNRNAYYVFASRSQPWANSDSTILASNNSVSQVEQTVYNDIIFGKLLQDEDVINVAPRYNWVANTVYAPYDQNDANMYDKQFFVVTDNYEVYKCIDNNNGGTSNVKPSLTSVSGTFKTGDGYIWKYMYSISSSSNTKFTTSEYIPVEANTSVRDNATPGSIDHIKITNGGNGYSVFETGYIAGIRDSLRIQLPSTSSGANGYYANSSIYLKSGFGAGQIREIQSYNGVSKQIVVSGNPLEIFTRLDLANTLGTVATGYYIEQRYDDVRYLYAKGYFNKDSTVAQSDTGTSGKVISSNSSAIQVTKSDPNAIFQVGLPIVDTSQSGAEKPGTVVVGNTGACNIAIVTSAGSGYLANSVAITITPSGLTGSGAAANAQVNSSGKVSSVSISTVGSAYFTAPTLTIPPPVAQTFNSNTSVTEGSGGGANSVITLGSSLAVTANTNGVSNTNNTLLITSANSFIDVGNVVFYSVPTGNTAIPNLVGNTFYFVTFANSSAVALSATLGGANVDIAETRTAAGETHRVISGTAHRLAINDLVTYLRTTGTSSIGLTNNTSYFVEFANQTSVALKSTISGSRVTLAKGETELGHALRGQTATALMYCDNQTVRGTGTSLNSVSDGYTSGDYIRIGANTTSNIRRVANVVNTTAITVASPFGTSFTASANLHYKMTTAAEPSSITPLSANGYVSDTNLTSIQLSISNSSLVGVNFLVGENVNLANSAGVKSSPSANAIIAFANSSVVILSNVSGTWLTNVGNTQLYVSGDSSLQLSRIDEVTSNPNITVRDQLGIFKLGYEASFRVNAESVSASGNAMLVAQFSLPNDLTEYQIGPTIRIIGDGVNAAGVAIVNNSVNSSYNIIGVDMIDPGSGYTNANVEIYANSNYGSGASARAIISPVDGHGYDPITELGGRYVGISSKFDAFINESCEFPGYVTFRQLGIIENPQFKEIKVTLTDFDRVNMTLTNYGGNTSWAPGEVVIQSTTNAAGIVVSGNSTTLQLKNVKGTFNVSNTINAYFSSSYANVATADVIRFPVGNAAAFITQSNSGSTGIVANVISNTVYIVSNVVGQFADGDVMYDGIVNAYATVDSISTVDGSKDLSASFGDRFNQTARITLTTTSGEFLVGEYVQQEISSAKGRVVSTTDEVDLVISSPSGSFFIGQTITDQTTAANGVCTFANSTYIKLSGISQDLSFANSDIINNGLGSSATIAGINPVLVLDDVSDANNFQAGSNAIVGSTSGARATCNNQLLIKLPDLVRDSGKLIYSESFAPVTRTLTSKEEVRLVIRF